MTAIQLAKPGDAEAIAAFANGSFTHTFGHIYDPADLSTFLADWNPPDRVRAQIASDDHDIAVVRSEAGAILGVPDQVGLDPADLRQADDQTLAAVEAGNRAAALVGLGHEAMRRQVDDMQVHITQLAMFADHPEINRMPGRPTQIGH